MTTPRRHTADTITDYSLGQLYDRLEAATAIADELRAALAKVRADRAIYAATIAQLSTQHGRARTAEAALDRVRDLHERDALGRCTYCTWLDDEAGSGLDVTWPCDTIRALDGAEPDTAPERDDQPRGCAIPQRRES